MSSTPDENATFPGLTHRVPDCAEYADWYGRQTGSDWLLEEHAFVRKFAYWTTPPEELARENVMLISVRHFDRPMIWHACGDPTYRGAMDQVVYHDHFIFGLLQQPKPEHAALHPSVYTVIVWHPRQTPEKFFSMFVDCDIKRILRCDPQPSVTATAMRTEFINLARKKWLPAFVAGRLTAEVMILDIRDFLTRPFVNLWFEICTDSVAKAASLAALSPEGLCPIPIFTKLQSVPAHLSEK